MEELVFNLHYSPSAGICEASAGSFYDEKGRFSEANRNRRKWINVEV
jgi:hypothetical protein